MKWFQWNALNSTPISWIMQNDSINFRKIILSFTNMASEIQKLMHNYVNVIWFKHVLPHFIIVALCNNCLDSWYFNLVVFLCHVTCFYMSVVYNIILCINDIVLSYIIITQSCSIYICYEKVFRTETISKIMIPALLLTAVEINCFSLGC